MSQALYGYYPTIVRIEAEDLDPDRVLFHHPLASAIERVMVNTGKVHLLDGFRIQIDSGSATMRKTEGKECFVVVPDRQVILDLPQEARDFVAYWGTLTKSFGGSYCSGGYYDTDMQWQDWPGWRRAIHIWGAARMGIQFNLKLPAWTMDIFGGEFLDPNFVDAYYDMSPEEQRAFFDDAKSR